MPANHGSDPPRPDAPPTSGRRRGHLWSAALVAGVAISYRLGGLDGVQVYGLGVQLAVMVNQGRR